MENPEIARTAACTISALDQPVTSLLAADPRALEALPGLGPRQARLIDETLGVRTLPQREGAVRAGTLSTRPGIGAHLEATTPVTWRRCGRC